MVSEPKIIDATEFADLLFDELVEIGRARIAARAGHDGAMAVGRPDELIFEATVEGFSAQYRGAVDAVVSKHGITGIQLRPQRTEAHAIVDHLLPGIRARKFEREVQQMIAIVADGCGTTP